MSKKVDIIPDGFYDLLQDSIYNQLLNKIDIESVKSHQKSHWQHIILHGNDEKIELWLKKNHKKHQKIGLPN